MAANAASDGRDDGHRAADGSPDASMEDILRSIREILGDEAPATLIEPRFPAAAQTANHEDNKRAAEPEKPKRESPLAFLQRRRQPAPASASDAPRPTLEERLARHREKAEAERLALRRLSERGAAASDERPIEEQLADALDAELDGSAEPQGGAPVPNGATDDLEDALFDAEPPRPKLALPDFEPEVIDYSGTTRTDATRVVEAIAEPDAEQDDTSPDHGPVEQDPPVPSAFAVPLEPAAAEPSAPEPSVPEPSEISEPLETLDPLEAAIEELAAPLDTPPIRPNGAHSMLRGTLDRTVEPIAAASAHDVADDLRAILSDDPAALDRALTELMRPLVAEWLDDNLPSVVERVVREEIERVSRPV